MAHKSSPAIHEGRRGLGNIESQLEALSGQKLVVYEVTERVNGTLGDIGALGVIIGAQYAITDVVRL